MLKITNLFLSIRKLAPFQIMEHASMLKDHLDGLDLPVGELIHATHAMNWRVVVGTLLQKHKYVVFVVMEAWLSLSVRDVIKV